MQKIVLTLVSPTKVSSGVFHPAPWLISVNFPVRGVQKFGKLMEVIYLRILVQFEVHTATPVNLRPDFDVRKL